MCEYKTRVIKKEWTRTAHGPQHPTKLYAVGPPETQTPHIVAAAVHNSLNGAERAQAKCDAVVNTKRDNRACQAAGRGVQRNRWRAALGAR